ncbi:MAG: DNA-processing protein DprA [Chloroflexi bacterium]|nr:DNA-processing protein DprA [Chloroflexota bacterium]
MSVDAAWVALSLVEHMGMTRLRALLAHFDSAEAVLRADESALRRVPGIGAVIAGAIHLADAHAIDADLLRWADQGIRVLTFMDADYPPLLRELPDAPATLFLRGPLDWTALDAVAIVGTRRPSPAGVTAAKRLSARLAGDGCCIVSGLARGIDTAAHTGALIAEGTTVAVLGCGVNQVYPPENAHLAEKILRVQRGGLISEVHPNGGTTASRLVARNRIIAGLCREVVVVESNDDGGAMHAARRAQELGRGVRTVDLPASGNRDLIAQGARLIDPDRPELT